MFTVKLGTGKAFEATAVDERYQPATEFVPGAKIWLNIEATPTDKSVEDYVGLLTEEGALGNITVSVDGEDCAVYTGSDTVSDISVRLLPTAGHSANITLEKSAG